MAPENLAIISLILYCICLKLLPSLFFAFPFIGVFVSIIYSCDVPFQFVERKGKWIRRELRLLRALSEDVKGVLKSKVEIDKEASELWNLKINPEMTELLNPTEEGWIARTDDLAFRGANLINRFQGCKERRQSDKWYFLNQTHYALFDEMKRMEKEIEAHFEEKSRVDICGILERSRTHFQSLQDRLKSTSSKKQDCAAAALISSILEKENEKRHSVDGKEEKIQPIELKLSLLLAFLKDLEGLHFQSETEKAWVEEACEIIGEAQCAIESFIQKTVGRFLVFTNWMAPRRKLMEDNGFSELLNRKERYCLKFIRRCPAKSVTRSPHQKENQISNRTVASHVEVKEQNWLDRIKKCLSGEYHLVKMLCDQLKEMDRLFEAANAIEGVDNSRKAWLYQMIETATKTEHTIEAYIQTEEERKEEGSYILNSLFDSKEENFFEYSAMGLFFPGDNSISERTQAAKLSEEHERMSKVIYVLQRSINLYRIEIRKETTSVVGLEEDIHGLISRLKTDEKPIVCIVGMRGVGKTTLAEEVYNHEAIKNFFKNRYWVRLSQKSFGNTLRNEDEKLILGDLETLGEQNGGSWIEKLHHFLGKEKNLLVLDNISSKEVWDTLINEAFPARTNGSKIMVTTRHKSVASHADQSSTQHLLRLRTKEESWKLFTQMVPEIPPESEKIIKAKFVGRCGGLPIAIFRLGYLLIGKHVTKENFLRELESESIKHYEEPWIEAVANEELTDQLMKCLAYIRLFPRDYEIPARRVIASWVAEEFVQQIAEDSPECDAEKRLADLMNMYIIQVLERKLDGKIKTFCLIDALRENWLQDEDSPTVLRKYKDPIAFLSFDEREGNKPGNDITVFQENEKPIAFLSFDVREGNKPGEDIENFLRRDITNGRFGLLKVLDLERVFRPILPKSIGDLNDLKYLGLRWTYLEEIPPSIGKLLNLQTLDVKRTYVRILPKSIWKLQKLRHLYLSQSHRSKFKSQPKASSLNNLETLWGLFLDDDSAIKNGLNKLTNLTKLGLTFDLELSKQDTVKNWVTGLTNLKSLRLRSIDEKGDAKNLRVMDLSNLKNLSSLYLFGKLENPLDKNLFGNLGKPSNKYLSDLTLSALGLVYDPMPILGGLPELRSLCFYFGSYKEKEMSWKGFPKLLVLKLWKLELLEELQVEAGAMPKLKELDIRCCKKLKVPTGLKHLNSLQELKLANMPTDFTAIQEKKWEIWCDIAYPPRITIENW